MGYQREKWHSGLTYERTCYGCQAIVHYTDHALDFRPWFADGYVDCPRCESHLRHNEEYAIPGSDKEPQKLKKPIIVPASALPAAEPVVEAAPVVKTAPVAAPVVEAAPVAQKPAYEVELEEQNAIVEAAPVVEAVPVVEQPAPVAEPVEQEVFVDAKPIEPVGRPRFCVQCGYKFNETDRFCALCGTKRG